MPQQSHKKGVKNFVATALRLPGYCWIAIQSQNWILDLDCQSSFPISIQIQYIKLFYHDIKIS